MEYKKEYLVITRDKHYSTGYAHNHILEKAYKQALSNIGARRTDVKKGTVKAIAYEYPEHLHYSINHFPMTITFSNPENPAENVNHLVKEVKEI